MTAAMPVTAHFGSGIFRLTPYPLISASAASRGVIVPPLHGRSTLIRRALNRRGDGLCKEISRSQQLGRSGQHVGQPRVAATNLVIVSSRTTAAKSSSARAYT